MNRTRPINVCLLIDELNLWRGTEIHLRRLLKTIDRDRIHPLVAVVHKATLAPTFRDQVREFISLDIKSVFGRGGVAGAVRLGRELRRHAVDLLVSYHTAADLLAPPVGRTLGLPVLSCRRDMGFTKKPVHLRMQRPLNRLLSGMISVSRAVAVEVERTEQYPLAKNQVIWNGEDLERFKPGPDTLRAELGLDEGALVVACVGSLSPVKDHRTLVRGFARVASESPRAVLLLVGDGPLREDLEVEAAPLGDRVRFLGHRKDVASILRAADIYAQTSLSEGFSNAVVQALACGLPVVATEVGGNPELVTPQCGILTPVGDDTAVAEALSQLLGSSEQREALGAGGRWRVECCGSLEVMAEAYCDAFERAVNGTFPGAPSNCIHHE